MSDTEAGGLDQHRPCDPLGGCVGAYFMEWQDRAVRAEAEVRALRTALDHASNRETALRDAGNQWMFRAREAETKAERVEVGLAVKVLRELAATIATTDADHVPVGAVIGTLADVADRLGAALDGDGS